MIYIIILCAMQCMLHICNARWRRRSVDVAEFILLELLRTETVDHDEVQYLKSVFDSIDKDKAGTIEYAGIEKEEEEQKEFFVGEDDPFFSPI